MALVDCLEVFLLEKKIAGLSGKSVSSYRMFITPFIRFVDCPLSSLTMERVNSYFLHLLERGLSKSTYATYVRNVKIFLVWCESRYGLSIGADSIKVPKSTNRNPYIYSDDDIHTIFDTIYSDDWISVRNCSIVALMLDSGLRQSECVSLIWKNVYIEYGYMNVYGKGDKERIVPLGSLSRKFLEEYTAKCPFTSNRVFVTRHGDDITNNTIKLFMHKYSRMFPFDFSCHRLRHNFATNFLLDCYNKNGFMDVFALMSIMGHENIETTKGYLHIANQIVYSKAHISHLDSIF